MRSTKLLIFITLFVFNVGCHANQGVARDPIPDLPDYPGATRIAYTTGDDVGHGFRKTIKVESVTTDPLNKVSQHFSGQYFVNNGWEYTRVISSTESVAESKSQVTIRASKGCKPWPGEPGFRIEPNEEAICTSFAKIEINEKGKDNIVITVERKDK